MNILGDIRDLFLVTYVISFFHAPVYVVENFFHHKKRACVFHVWYHCQEPDY